MLISDIKRELTFGNFRHKETYGTMTLENLE